MHGLVQVAVVEPHALNEQTAVGSWRPQQPLVDQVVNALEDVETRESTLIHLAEVLFVYGQR